jgi:hypothetical protein
MDQIVCAYSYSGSVPAVKHLTLLGMQFIGGVVKTATYNNPMSLSCVS